MKTTHVRYNNQVLTDTWNLALWVIFSEFGWCWKRRGLTNVRLFGVLRAFLYESLRKAFERPRPSLRSHQHARNLRVVSTSRHSLGSTCTVTGSRSTRSRAVSSVFSVAFTTSPDHIECDFVGFGVEHSMLEVIFLLKHRNAHFSRDFEDHYHQRR